MKLSALQVHIEICKIKTENGFTAKNDILKLATEEHSHEHYGGDLIGGTEIGADILNSPTHGSISVKGRPAGKLNKLGLPSGMTPIRTRHWNFDYVAAVPLHPETHMIMGIYEWTMQYFYDNSTFDHHDHRWEMNLTIEHLKVARFIPYERKNN